jgi:hypothetical protein
MNDAYGVDISKAESNKRNYWNVTFCVAKVTDGNIRVYSPNYIMVKWMTADRRLPREGQEIFRSEDLAKAFLIKNFSQLV